jgi:hypothetical protein
MFHVLLAFFDECVLLSTTSIVVSSASSVHNVLFLHVANVRFYGIVGLLLFDASSGGRFSLFIECRGNMLLHHLQGTVKFLVGFFLVPTSKNLMVYILAQPMVCLSLFRTQPKNPKNVISLEIGLMHVLIDV